MTVAVTYEWPPGGATGTTPSDKVSGTIVTDGSAVSISVTHNLNMSAADLAAGLPEVYIEPLTQLPFYSGQPYVINKTANFITFGFQATTFNFRFNIKRPNTIGR